MKYVLLNTIIIIKMIFLYNIFIFNKGNKSCTQLKIKNKTLYNILLLKTYIAIYS